MGAVLDRQSCPDGAANHITAGLVLLRAQVGLIITPQILSQLISAALLLVLLKG